MSDAEAKVAQDLIDKNKNDNDPPMVREVKFNSLNGSEISVGIHDKADKVEVENVGVRSKVEILFTEPIDARFLDGIKITNVGIDKPVDKVEILAISPQNVEVVILPPEKSDGRILDYDTEYRLDIAKVSDYNGNKLSEGPEVIFKTESPGYEGVNVPEAFDDGSSGAQDGSSRPPGGDPFSGGVPEAMPGKSNTSSTGGA
jgi:hypothetical protein